MYKFFYMDIFVHYGPICNFFLIDVIYLFYLNNKK